MSNRTGVLLASADEGTRSQVRLTLGDQRFEVREAQDTDAAVVSVATSPPKLLIIDIGLPGTGALALTRTLRGHSTTSGLKTLLLVGRVDELPQDLPGVDEMLVLPVTGFALLRKVEALLGTI